MVESVYSLVITGNRVVVGDIKLRVFLYHVLAQNRRPDAATKLGHKQAEQRRQSGSEATTTSGSPAAFMARLPATPQPHFSLRAVLMK